MIQTTVNDLSRYESLNPLFPAAFSALKALASGEFIKGRHEVDGDHIFINAAEYDTNPVERSGMEHHKRGNHRYLPRRSAPGVYEALFLRDRCRTGKTGACIYRSKDRRR